MQQLHRRKIREYEELCADSSPLEAEIARAAQCGATERLVKLRQKLELVQSHEILTKYLLDFMPFANEEADIQCEFAMRRRDANGNPERLFELSQDTTAKLQDLTRRYKQRFWPALVDRADDGPFVPLQTRDVDDVLVGYQQESEGGCETRRCTYRRINHFREYLRQQQGKSRVTIPPDVLNILRLELKKHHIDAEECTPLLVRYLLKNLNQQATRAVPKTKGTHQSGFCWALVYEHTPTITILLNPNYRLIDIPPERERLLCHLFEKTEAPFEKYKLAVKKGRKNFLSYPYMTYKLCELMGWDEYLPAFSLLKSDELLQLQDSYFKKICEDLHWQFVPTVGRIDIRETLGAKE
jgi:hypothetical protein